MMQLFCLLHSYHARDWALALTHARGTSSDQQITSARSILSFSRDQEFLLQLIRNFAEHLSRNDDP